MRHGIGVRGARGDFLQDPAPTQVLTGTCVSRGSSHDEVGTNDPQPFRMPSIRSLAVTLHRHLAPLTLGLTIGALCLYQGHREEKYKHRDYLEAFPFSHYPMYSDFDDFDYVMFIGKLDGTPLMIETVTQGYKANALKKKFDNLIDKLKDEKNKGIRNREATVEQMRPSGEAVLQSLSESFPGVAAEVQSGGVGLYQVRIEMKEGALTESPPILVAQLNAKNAPPAP